MISFSIEGRIVDIFPARNSGRPMVILNTFSREGERVYEELQARGCPDFTLAAASGLQWNHDMSPWPNSIVKKRRPLRRRSGCLPWFPARGDPAQSRRRRCGRTVLARNCRLFSGGAFCPVRHSSTSNGHLFPGRLHIRIFVVSGIQGLCLCARSEKAAGLPIFLAERPRCAHPQSDAANR